MNETIAELGLRTQLAERALAGAAVDHGQGAMDGVVGHPGLLDGQVQVPESRRAFRRPAEAGPGGPHPVMVGEKLFKFLARLILEKVYGPVTIKFEAGKVTHAEAETRRAWPYKNLPDEPWRTPPQGEPGAGRK